MPWRHTETYPLPETDVVSFSFGDPSYDLDKPVRITFQRHGDYQLYNLADGKGFRYTMTSMTQPERYRTTRAKR